MISIGEGPGPQTSDGCSVELYRRLPYCGELELIEEWIAGTRLLELGCGVGRLTRRFLARGYHVTAVDHSPEMLAYAPREATLVCSNIEDLTLDAKFDTAILASSLVNTPEANVLSAFLGACHRHLEPAGALLFERYDPSWLSTVVVGRVGVIGDVELHVDRVERCAHHVEMSLRYRAGAEEWRHHFGAAMLTDEDLSACLAESGFKAPSWINRRWGRALKEQR